MSLRTLIIALSLLIVTATAPVLQAATTLDYELTGVEKSELKKNIGLYLANISFSGTVPDEATQEPMKALAPTQEPMNPHRVPMQAPSSR